LQGYPEQLIRGIANSQFIDSNGLASGSLFQFIDTHRSDGFYEVSINWYDEKEALQHILEQKKDGGTFQFKVGAAILQRSVIDDLIQNKLNNLLSYERAPLDGNKYHGNILRKDGELSPEIQRGIAATIALMGVKEIQYRDEE